MNKYEQRSKKSYDRIAEIYDMTADGRFTTKFKDLLIQTIIVSPKDTVADIACGNGRLLKQLASKSDFCGFGVDISEKMIEQAQKLNPNMKFYSASCENLPFTDNQTSVMTVCAAFHHFPHIERFAKEAERVIQKGGMLYIAEVYLPTGLRVLCNPFIRLSKSGDVKIYKPSEITSLFEHNGFTTINVKVENGVQVIVLQKN